MQYSIKKYASLFVEDSIVEWHCYFLSLQSIINKTDAFFCVIAHLDIFLTT